MKEKFFDKCLPHLQEFMPDFLEEIEEYVQTAKRQKIQIDELEEKIKELEDAQTEKDVRAFGREAEEREVIRLHEKEMMAAQIALADSKFKTATLEAEIGKMAGGGTSGVGKKELSTLTLDRMTDETEFLVKGAFHWAEIVRLMENLREHPEQWEEARIWRQFSQTVMTQFVARLHQLRVSNLLPKNLAGFDNKVGRNCKFFSTPASTEFTFADYLEWYLRANDRDKKGKIIIPPLYGGGSDENVVGPCHKRWQWA